MSMPATVRQINAARALERLLAQGAMSRADLARELGLTRSTASRIAAELIEEGRVIERAEDGAARGQRSGRPAIRLQLNPDHALFLGADIAAGHLRLAAVDFVGRVRHLSDRPVAATRPEDLAEALARMVAAFRAAQPRPAAIRGLNVSVPGIVDLAGEVLRAPPLGWSRVPLQRLLRARLDPVPVAGLVNDANAFAVAAREAHGGEALSDAVFLFIDEGVGACLLGGGRILYGRDGFAGEMGHIPMGEPGFDDRTGLPGAFENFVARRAILARYAALGGGAVDLAAFLARLEAGDPRAARVAADWARIFGRGMAVLAALLNPQTIVIGGRVAPLFRHAAAEVAARMTGALMPGSAPPRLEPARIGPEGPAVGAALMLQRRSFAGMAEAVAAGEAAPAAG